jgi:flagellar basal-body rod protein FlgB
MTVPIAGMHEALDYHLSRHNLLASNLAHVDTPGFRARDLHRNGSFEGVLATRMATTQPEHVGPHPRTANWEVRIDRFAPVGPDGNGVNLDRESVKIASNNLRYDAISTMLQGQLQTLQWAAQEGK